MREIVRVFASESALVVQQTRFVGWKPVIYRETTRQINIVALLARNSLPDNQANVMKVPIKLLVTPLVLFGALAFVVLVEARPEPVRALQAWVGTAFTIQTKNERG